jgi:hypothetical protein
MAQRDDFSLERRVEAKANHKGLEEQEYQVEHGRSRLTVRCLKFYNLHADTVFSRHSISLPPPMPNEELRQLAEVGGIWCTA